MQETSALYKELFARYQAGERYVRFETRLQLGPAGEIEVEEKEIFALKTRHRMFPEDVPSAGGCVAGEIDIEVLPPAQTLPRQARIVPTVRLTDGILYSEWIQKGVFFIDTRATIPGAGYSILRIHGYDAMLAAEQDYLESSLSWPARDYDVVQEIAGIIGVEVDSRTLEQMIGYEVQFPVGYSCREVLGYIAASYAGCFVISDMGKLRLIALHGIPVETNYLVNESGDAITFGGDRILV